MELDRLTKEHYFSDLVSTLSGDRSASSASESQHPFPSPSLSYLSNSIYYDLLEGDILSSDVDEVKLTEELAEEDIQDSLEIVQSKKYEKNLWKTHC
jgi:hypothetical protein